MLKVVALPIFVKNNHIAVTYKDTVAEHTTAIPWATEKTWTQITSSLDRSFLAMGPQAESLRTMAKQIVDGYAAIEKVLESLCLASCPSCTDVCCTRATVWYDLPDLLLIYLSGGVLPDRQIYRRSDHSCCNLTISGCRLDRSLRPFICTWYICPEQRKCFGALSDCAREAALFRTIDDIKTVRKALQKAYLNAVSG